MDALFASLGDEIHDADEGQPAPHSHTHTEGDETFDVFSQTMPSRDLGMVDPKAASLELSISGRDFEIVQSPGVLQSSRESGTTGAVVWQASVRFAEWLVWSKNPLLKYGVISATSNVLELGSGISGVVPSVLSTLVQRVCATDQTYILKTLRENIESNARQQNVQHKKSGKSNRHQGAQINVDVFALDWENDDIPSLMASHGLPSGVDMIVACDCIYNYALITPFVQTCVDVCRARHQMQQALPTITVVAQQLRQADVFQQWLEAFHQHFRVWRVPTEMLSESLREGSGFIVHVGALRD